MKILDYIKNYKPSENDYGGWILKFDNKFEKVLLEDVKFLEADLLFHHIALQAYKSGDISNRLNLMNRSKTDSLFERLEEVLSQPMSIERRSKCISMWADMSNIVGINYISQVSNSIMLDMYKSNKSIYVDCGFLVYEGDFVNTVEDLPLIFGEFHYIYFSRIKKYVCLEKQPLTNYWKGNYTGFSQIGGKDDGELIKVKSVMYQKFRDKKIQTILQ